MTKRLEDMTFEEMEEARADIRRQRAELHAVKNGNGSSPEDADSDHDAPPEEIDDAAESEDDDKPEPWPHQHLMYAGMDLEVRTPHQSALMAISMLQQLDGHGELQMEIFNTFLSNHLSPPSLAEVIKEMTRPDTELTLQGLVQALVELRIKQD